MGYRTNNSSFRPKNIDELTKLYPTLTIVRVSFFLQILLVTFQGYGQRCSSFFFTYFFVFVLKNVFGG